MSSLSEFTLGILFFGRNEKGYHKILTMKKIGTLQSLQWIIYKLVVPLSNLITVLGICHKAAVQKKSKCLRIWSQHVYMFDMTNLKEITVFIIAAVRYDTADVWPTIWQADLLPLIALSSTLSLFLNFLLSRWCWS